MNPTAPVPSYNKGLLFFLSCSYSDLGVRWDSAQWCQPGAGLCLLSPISTTQLRGSLRKQERKEYLEHMQPLTCLDLKPSLVQKGAGNTCSRVPGRGQVSPLIPCLHYLDNSRDKIQPQLQIIVPFLSHHILVLVEGTRAEGHVLEVFLLGYKFSTFHRRDGLKISCKWTWL